MDVPPRSPLRPSPLAGTLLAIALLAPLPLGPPLQARTPAAPAATPGAGGLGARSGARPGGDVGDCAPYGETNTWGTRTTGPTVAGWDGGVFEFGTYRGAVDFDPDPHAAEWRANTTTDCEPELYFASYSPSGSLRFVHVFPATRRGEAAGPGVHVHAVVADAHGVAFTGDFLGRVDFDPDPDGEGAPGALLRWPRRLRSVLHERRRPPLRPPHRRGRPSRR